MMGPAQQSPGKESPEVLIVSSGPITLDIRPLSDYQKMIVSSLFKLRFRGWNDRQIANHCTEISYLTPRGRR